MGRKSGKKNMIYCRRCGKRTLNLHKSKCASCGFGGKAKIRGYKFHKKFR